MGLSSLTRYNLFMESADFIKNEKQIIQFKDPGAVEEMYHDSAQLILEFEDIMNNRDDIPLAEECEMIFNRNAIKVSNEASAQRIKYYIQKQIEKNENQLYKSPFKTYFRFLLKAIANYQEEIIKENYIGITDTINIGRKQTFLSYAYYDKGLTQALFCYFWLRDGFLFVDWMWDGINSHSSLTKSKLEKVLSNSNQFLFLRTTNSELKIPGNNSVRQWCAWEIGNFYTKHKDEKYYTSFYDRDEPRNDILDTFRPMKEVVSGEII